MPLDTRHIQPGWSVYGADGDKIGDVAEIGPNYLLVQKGLLFTKDLYIPSSAIVGVESTAVTVNAMARDVDSLGWDAPPAEQQARTTNVAVAGTDRTPLTGSSVRTSEVTPTPVMAPARVSSRVAATEARDEVVLPVVEEQLRVGKREVEAGGVRVEKRVEEHPVQEQVTLRDEEVQVERVPVNQPVDPTTMRNLDEAFIPVAVEMQEHDEVAVVEKQARVVEEVIIDKDVEERTETVQATIRRTDVDVTEIDDQRIRPNR